MEISASSLRWNVTKLHPNVEYQVKVRSAALLGYGPFSAVKFAKTLEAGMGILIRWYTYQSNCVENCIVDRGVTYYSIPTAFRCR